MKKKILSAVSVVMLVAVLLSLCACNGTVKNKLEEANILLMLNDFQKACNDLDTDAILDCLHPDIVNKLKPYMSIFESFTDKSLPELLFSAFAEASGELSEIDDEFFSSMKIELKDIKMTGENTAQVNISISFVLNGRNVSRTAAINCEKADGKWYIKSFNIG